MKRVVGLCLWVAELEVHCQPSVLLFVFTATCQQCVGFNANISVEKRYWYWLQLYLSSDPRIFLLVAASVFLLRSSCLLLGYSTLKVILLSVVVLRFHRLMVKTVFISVAPV